MRDLQPQRSMAHGRITVARRRREEPEQRPRTRSSGSRFVLIPGRLPEAIQEYQIALRIKPDFANCPPEPWRRPWRSFPVRSAEAIREFEAALRIDPDMADAHMNLGAALSQASRSSAGRDLRSSRPRCGSIRISSRRTTISASHWRRSRAVCRSDFRIPGGVAAQTGLSRRAAEFGDRAGAHSRPPAGSDSASSRQILRADAGIGRGSSWISASHLSQIPERRSEAIAQYEAALADQSGLSGSAREPGTGQAAIPGTPGIGGGFGGAGESQS